MSHPNPECGPALCFLASTEVWQPFHPNENMSAMPQVQSAEFNLAVRPLRLNAKVAVTPAGLMAITALVTGILLATAVIVSVAKR